MAGTTVYAPNGATFNCDTQERLDHYLKAGWSKKPVKKGKADPPKGDNDPPKGEPGEEE